MLERLQKVMATAGVASRRKCQEIIKQGRVKVDGKVVLETGFKVNPNIARIEVDGVLLKNTKLVYLVMNKPKGCVTTMSDPQKRKTVVDYLPEINERVKPVGRLDYNTEGLLLFTNDGELMARLTHPKYGVWKTYEVEVYGEMTAKEAQKLERGVLIEGRKTSEAKVKILGYDAKNKKSKVEISIHEGRKHQVKNMFLAIGKKVINLKRIKYATLTLKKLRKGECKMLSKVEVQKLRKSVGLE